MAQAASTIHVGSWSIVSLRDLLVPCSIGILVLNRLSLARDLLFTGSSLCCIPRLVMAWECF
ncbi:hypothetical protein J4G37_24430 [Microvirga sp. 3-52]|nr:hypothetical protein [Microvirga sp. 3-52]